MIRLLPELDLGGVTVVPTVSDNAVSLGGEAGEHARLHAASDGGKNGRHTVHRALVRKRTKTRRQFQQAAVQADNEENGGGLRHRFKFP